MKKLSTANSSLDYPQRKALMAEFVPADLTSDEEVASYIEKAGEGMEAFVLGVKNDHCADTILSWA